MVDTSVMPTVFRSTSTSVASTPSSLARAACMPRSMLMPWSASPIAESSLVRCSLFSAIVDAYAFTQARTSSYKSDLLGTPPQSRRVDRGVPELRQLGVELQQRDRAPGHFERRDVGPDQDRKSVVEGKRG